MAAQRAIWRERRQRIAELRLAGNGYGCIAVLLGMSDHRVRDICQSMDLGGVRGPTYPANPKLSKPNPVCATCGKVFTRTPSATGRPPKCCPTCTSAADAERRARLCRECGASLPSHRSQFCSTDCGKTWGKKNKKPSSKVYPSRNCEGCGKEYRPAHKKGRFCSTSCASTMYARRRAPRICEGCGCSYTPWQTGRTRFCTRDCYSAHMRGSSEQRVTTEVPLPCAVCGNEVHLRKSLVCSEDCQRTRSIAQAKARGITTHVHTSCRQCGVQLPPDFVAKRREFCGVPCAKKCAKFNNSSRVRERYVAHVYFDEVFKRCGAACGICGDVVDTSLKAPHPLRATLDHITPLGVGGTHEPSNVQPAHFFCNSFKSDKADLTPDDHERLRLYLAIRTA